MPLFKSDPSGDTWKTSGQVTEELRNAFMSIKDERSYFKGEDKKRKADPFGMGYSRHLL